MSLWVIAGCVAAPGHHDRLRTALEAMIERCLDEPGCQANAPHSDPNGPACMVVVKEWTGPQALAAHFTEPYFRHAEQVLGQILAQPPTSSTGPPASALSR